MGPRALRGAAVLLCEGAVGTGGGGLCQAASLWGEAGLGRPGRAAKCWKGESGGEFGAVGALGNTATRGPMLWGHSWCGHRVWEVSCWCGHSGLGKGLGLSLPVGRGEGQGGRGIWQRQLFLASH